MKTKNLLLIFTVLFSAFLIVGCATKRYGRMTTLSPAEKQHYTIRDIDLEISKVNQFLLQVEEGAEIDWRSVAGFLGDWGIGNAMEKNNAVKSARERLAELEALKYEKLAEQSQD